MRTPGRLLFLALLAMLSGTAPGARPAVAGGVPMPEALPPYWITVRPGPGAEILQFLKTVPQDPNALGVRAAHFRTKAYPYTFAHTTFSSLDGTPLVGRWIGQRYPRPGVVLVPGFSQSKDHKYIVELADLFSRNGWSVLAFDLRDHGETRRASKAPVTNGWKEADDILAAVRALRTLTKATSVSVVGFSLGGRGLVKAMAQDSGDIAAGIAVTAPLGIYPPTTPPEPGYTPSPLARFFLDFLGTKSFYEYDERAARFYGVDLRTLEARDALGNDVAKVKAPLLALDSLDDALRLARIKQGGHDGATFSLAYRDLAKDNPSVHTFLVDRGNHAGMLYLSDPYWFGVTAMSYLKHWQARNEDAVTIKVPALDILAEGTLNGPTATYRFVVRNHGANSVGPLDVSLDMPAGARLSHCWLGAEGLGRCTPDASRLTWTLPRLSGQTTAGPFGAVLDLSGVKPGSFEAVVSVPQEGVVAQEVPLEKP
jgi:alpha-beta hydrolase superfamily lysophospholipase